MKQRQWLLKAVITASVMMVVNASVVLCAINPVFTEGTCPVGSPQGKWWTVTEYDQNGNVTCIIGHNCLGAVSCSCCPPPVPPRGEQGGYGVIIGYVPAGTHAVYTAGSGNILWTVIEYDNNDVEVCRVTKYIDGTVTTNCDAPQSRIQSPAEPQDQVKGNQELNKLSCISINHNNIIGVVESKGQITPNDVVGLAKEPTELPQPNK